MAPQNTEDRKEADNGENDNQQTPLNDEAIVISGMAGKFPNSNDIYQFRDNLLNKTDLVSLDHNRWKLNHTQIPKRHGKINDIHDFDAGAFGFDQTHGSETDPMLRQLLEKCFEAIVDAGYNPAELAGTNTGVFVGSTFSEQASVCMRLDTKPNAFPIIGHFKSMLAQRISYCYKLTGPSFNVDTACSSSFFALDHAYRALKQGQCEKAIVGGVALCLRPMLTLQFSRLGVLNMEGKCRSFDDAANGYARADAFCAIFLEKSKDARRIYAHLIHTKVNCDGFKEQGITCPSVQAQMILMNEVYEECNVSPSDVVFVEAHGTGTVVGDLPELNSIDKVFCSNRKQPLYIGSVKANIGHSEPSSGLCSIVKVLLGFECGYIPPNINFEKNRQGATGLENGRMKVLTEKLPLVGTTGIAAVNNFGFGGANGHVVLRWNTKVKRNDILKDNIPRLVGVSGRTQEAIDKILDDIEANDLDPEFVKLLHTVFRENIASHIYRGFSLVSKTEEIHRSINFLGLGDYKKLCLVFNNFDKKLLKIGSQLLALPPFAKSILRVQIALQKEDSIDILDASGNFIEENVISAILSSVAVQIGLADTLKELALKPDTVIGIGFGDLVAAYYVDFLTLEETLLLTHYVILRFTEKNKEKNSDYLSQELIQRLNVTLKERKISPNWLLCHQSHDSIQGSVNYFSKNIINPISFDQVYRTISSESAVFVIGSKPNHQNIIFIKDDQKNYLNNFLVCLGRLYENGFNMELDRLYPKIDFPLSRGTRMLSPLIKWDHSRAWKVYTFTNQELMVHGSLNAFINKKEDDWAFVAGHVIDGRNLFPATGYLHLVWDTLSLWIQKPMNEFKVVFEDVRFMKAANVPDKDALYLVTHLHYQSDIFEITEGDTVIVSGKVYEATDDTNDLTPLSVEDTNELEPVMNEKDIYKELKLRGYHYTDQFRCLKKCNMSATRGIIQWAENYVCFMDNMLQMKILQIDSRNLYVPTSIDMVIIDPIEHTKFAAEQNNAIDVYVNRESNILRSGAIEIRGLKASVIPKKKYAEPVLETYKFIPNQAKLSTDEAIRVIVQIILENNPVIKVKSVELTNDELSNNLPLLSPLIQKCLGDLPLIQQETIVLSKMDVDLPGIVVKNRKLFDESNCILVVGRTMLKQPQVLETALNCTKEMGGFILSRESLSFDATEIRNNDVTVFCVYENKNEKLVLLRQATAYTSPAAIDMSDGWGTLNWLPTLQNVIKKNDRVVVYAQNQDDNGILGFVNCLRREVNSSIISCFVLGDGAPQFDLDHPFYKKQLHKNIAINVWKSGKWGTYRHLLLDKRQSVETEHCYVNATIHGNLSSLNWIEGTLSAQSKVESERTLVQVYSAAINFRDVMLATGRIAADVIAKGRAEQECVLGFEFSGKDSSGKRVMGMVDVGGLATLLMADSNLLWPVPDHWSMEDAATVPVVYGTVLHALIMRANARRGQSILIHSGTGGVGQAAINVALHYGLTVFTTVGTKEKRNFIKQHYPEIPKSHIGNSRDCSFEQMVYNATKGLGVDIVLNSLAEEKLLASVRCVAKGGTFLEIGKFDLVNDNALALQLFEKGVTFEGVMLDTLFSAEAYAKAELGKLLLKAIADGAVKPLPRSIFKDDEIEQAFRFMTTGKHIGKVLIQVKKEETAKEDLAVRQIKAIPRFHANPEATYIILGGLGGFGLELADYLVLRGARNLILSSRTGISNGYQAFRIKNWKSLDANIIICTDDVTTKEGCISTIKTATKLAPVEGIFNLAVVLEDDLFENQTVEKFKKSLRPKALTTKYFDVISRNLCPQLRYFVVFSSVSCGRGNAGQTNYGMANSIMERICERRKDDGYPALAIQWGAIGDVGLVAQMQEDHRELVISGTLQQKIANCLELLDVFLKQSEPIVASMVVAEKKSSTGKAKTVIETLLNIIGIHDLKTVSIHASLPELGMDSMMAVEIKQVLEREYEVLLTPQDIRTMTLARVQELARTNKSATETNETPSEEPTSDLMLEGLQLLVKNLGDETTANLPIIHMTNTVHTNKNTPKIFALPGIEGMAPVLNTLMKNINGNVTCLQFCTRDCPDSITEMAKSIIKHMDLSTSNTFILIAYSFGTLVATELVQMLEQRGYYGKVVFIDGAPELLQRIAKLYFNFRSDENFQISLICFLMARYLSLKTVLESKADLEKCKSFEERIQFAISTIEYSQHSQEYMADCIRAIYKRLNAVFKYRPNFGKLKSELKLIKPTRVTIRGIESDYKLTDLFENVDVSVFDGDHATILENLDVSAEVNKFIHMEAGLKQNGHRNGRGVRT